MNKQTLIDKLTEFLMDDQLESQFEAANVATRFAASVECFLDDDYTYGELRWTPPDIIDQAKDVYGIDVTREQAINIFETELNKMKFVNDMDYGWSLIDEAIEKRFNVQSI